MMILGITVISFHGRSIESSYAAQVDYEQWEQILNTYVNDDGWVNYDDLKANRMLLDSFIKDEVEDADLEALTKDGKKAFWINAYNALTMRLIVDHYPLRFGGIRTINWGKPWDIKMKVAGQKLTLGDIEHKILRKWDPIDPRIHFAINCASVSCPRLANTHFDPDKLDQQLDVAAKRFVNDPEKNRIDRNKNIFYHSAILNWFEEDFLANHPDKLSYILEYLNDDEKQFVLANKNKIKLKEIKYDWGLNKQ